MNYLIRTVTTLFVAILLCTYHTQLQAAELTEPGDTSIVLPEGTKILVKLSHSISSEYAYMGSSFEGTIASDVTYQGRTIIPAGNWVDGVIMDAERAKNIGGRARLALELTDIGIGRWAMPVVTDQLGFVGKGSDTGIKTGAGAAIGAFISGWGGMVKGAAVGLGISAVTPGKQIYLHEGMILEFYLAEPIIIKSEQM